MPELVRAPRPVAVRWLVPVLGLVFAIVAVAFTPGQWWENALLALPVLLFAAWARWRGTIFALGVVTPAIVIVVCAGNELEPSMFLVSLLSLVAAAWEPRRWLAWIIVAVCIATPIIASPLGDGGLIWPIWVLGIGFPAAVGLIIRRLETVTAELAAARQELAERAVADERQRIGRDVHDLVGHGLAAVMLHLTGARHVLHRDPDAADRALRTAEQVGRESMHELRRTVALLRSDSPADDQPPASLRLVHELAGTYAGGGLDLDYAESGELEAVPPATALATYRIAQQALANAARHAPAARTVVRLTATDNTLELLVESHGAARTRGTGGHGLASMRERARVAGGQLEAGPSEVGWTVRCRLPLTGGAG